MPNLAVAVADSLIADRSDRRIWSSSIPGIYILISDQTRHKDKFHHHDYRHQLYRSFHNRIT
jgi:hypothetical protein